MIFYGRGERLLLPGGADVHYSTYVQHNQQSKRDCWMWWHIWLLGTVIETAYIVYVLMYLLYLFTTLNKAQQITCSKAIHLHIYT